MLYGHLTLQKPDKVWGKFAWGVSKIDLNKTQIKQINFNATIINIFLMYSFFGHILCCTRIKQSPDI